MKSSGIFVLVIIAISLFSCKPAEILLHGDITGIVTDAETSLPIQAASVKLNNTDYTTTAGTDGSFLLRNIVPDNYEIQSSKIGYSISKKNVTVAPAKTEQIDFPLNGIPVPGYSSTCLDFGLDSTNLTLSISNLGKGVFTYVITKSQLWISVVPSSGQVTNESENVRITINKNGLSENVYNGLLEVTSTGPGVLIKDTIHVNLNGVADRDCNYYKVVTIGTQIWMAENLNIGNVIPVQYEQTDNGSIEKWCNDCKTYGGLYNWYEAMQYNPSDTGVIGKTQGICPVGWHIPTEQEVHTLSDYLGGNAQAGGKLKATGISLWQSPNYGATNGSGFTAIPGGYTARGDNSNQDAFTNESIGKGTYAFFWLSNFYPQVIFDILPIDAAGNFNVAYNNQGFGVDGKRPANWGSSVRCVKNPAK